MAGTHSSSISNSSARASVPDAFPGYRARAHTPEHAVEPTSGRGASLRGGRYNPPGRPLLYLSTSPHTALREVGHGFERLADPTTLVAYVADVEDVVDLTTSAARRTAGVNLEDLACPWFEMMAGGATPRSWLVAERLFAAGAAGLLVPSFAAGSDPDQDRNLVLARYGTELPFLLLPHDPNRLLPRSRASWASN